MDINFLKSALSNGLIHTTSNTEDEASCAFFFDLNAYDNGIEKLKNAFPSHFLHAAAVKANPLYWFLKHRHNLGLGAECASIEEVHLSILAETPLERIVFDSPTKRVNEIKFVLEKAIHMNIDSFEEFSRVASLVNEMKEQNRSVNGRIGVRVNPLVGAGTIDVLSVSTAKSKFGIPLPSGPTLTSYEKAERQKLLDLVVDSQFVNCIHVHCGSGGMGVKKLCTGVKIAVNFALEVNVIRKEKGFLPIDCIDIGGGLAINFGDKYQPELTSIDSNVFAEYAKALREEVPQLFDETIFKQVVTEFGASINMSYGYFVSKVEYTKRFKQHNIVCLHGGSDLFLRHSYGGKKFAQNSVAVMNTNGKFLKVRCDQNKTEVFNETHDFVGPLCFAGDIILKEVYLPRDSVKADDWVVVFDCGANSFALKNMHCSKLLPAVYGFRQKEGKFTFEVIKQKQTLAHLAELWK